MSAPTLSGGTAASVNVNGSSISSLSNQTCSGGSSGVYGSMYGTVFVLNSGLAYVTPATSRGMTFSLSPETWTVLRMAHEILTTPDMPGPALSGETVAVAVRLTGSGSFSFGPATDGRAANANRPPRIAVATHGAALRDI